MQKKKMINTNASMFRFALWAVVETNATSSNDSRSRSTHHEIDDRSMTASSFVRSFVQFVRRTKLVDVFSYYLFFLYIHYCRIYLSIKSLRCADTKMLSSSAFTFYTHVRYRLSTCSNGYAPSLYRVFSKSGATTERATIRREKFLKNRDNDCSCLLHTLKSIELSQFKF